MAFTVTTGSLAWSLINTGIIKAKFSNVFYHFIILRKTKILQLHTGIFFPHYDCSNQSYFMKHTREPEFLKCQATLKCNFRNQYVTC